MNCEKIIVELLGRIQMLEEKVDILMNDKKENAQKDTEKVTTEDIRNYIKQLKINAKISKNKVLVLTARDIHRELNLTSRFPMVCNAMRDCMEDGDVILFQPPKGNSSTLQIEYRIGE